MRFCVCISFVHVRRYDHGTGRIFALFKDTGIGVIEGETHFRKVIELY